MIKCKVNENIEITVSADISGLSGDEQATLLRKTAELASEFAKKLGFTLADQEAWTE